MECEPRKKEKFARYTVTLLVALLGLIVSDRANAKAGTHGMSVSSFDTTRSSVVFAYRNGFIDGGHLRMASYNANFTSSTGKLSAQFGLHYLNYQANENSDAFHGFGATAISVYGIPVADRYENGLPKAAFTIFFGGSPSAIVSKTYNLITFAVPVGLAIPFWPSRHFGIVPWGEVAFSFNVDTKINPYSNSEDDPEEWVDPETGETQLDPDQVNDIMEEAVEMETSFAARFRGGLSFIFNLGDRVDLTIDGVVGHLGPEFNGTLVIFAGGSLSFAWDDPPPSVLPAQKRLEKEECRQVYTRFKQCPFYPKMIEKAEKRGEDKCMASPAEDQDSSPPATKEEPLETTAPKPQ